MTSNSKFLMSIIWTIVGIILYFRTKNKDMASVKMLMCFILAAIV